MLNLPFVEALRSAWARSQDTLGTQTLLFVSLTLRALGLVLLVGIPLGLALARLPRLASPVLAVLGLVQTIPSLVLLGLLMPLLGIGPQAALFAAVVYSIFPVVLNTCVGITQVAPSVRDAARGMGMTAGQLLWHVELPLALPTVLAGVRAAAIYVSGMIVIGALIGAGGLGDYIMNGLSRADIGLVWLGALPVLLLTLLLFWGLGALAVLARRNSALGLTLGGSLILALSGYAVFGLVERVFITQRPDVIIGAKDFTEGEILAEILKQTIEAHTGLPVEIKQHLGTSVVLQALQTGSIDLYAEYTGVLLTSKDGLDQAVPADRATITPLVRDEMRRRHGLVLLEPFGLDNTYALCVRAATAQRYQLRTISDLRRTPRLRVVVDQSFMTRPDGWPGLSQRYDLHFDAVPLQVNPNLLYQALEQREADLVVGFATDWQIAAQRLIVLTDDLGYFPQYHAAPLARADWLARHPEVRSALDRLAGQIDDQTMRRLNYQVSVEKRSESAVARAFLLSKEIIRE